MIVPQRLEREARVWMALDHQNIVPLLGLISGELGPGLGPVSEELVPGLVSPWYSHGNILEYIQQVPNVPREPLVMPECLHDFSFGVLTKLLSAKMWQAGSDISTSKFRRLYMVT
jgi:hypothetical protein